MRATTVRLCTFAVGLALALTACSGSGNGTTGQSSNATASTASLADLKPGQVVDKDAFFTVTKAAADKNKTYAFVTQIGQDGSVLRSQGVVDNSDPADRKRQLTITDANGIESQMVIAEGQVFVKTAEGPDARWSRSPVSPAVEQVLEGASQRIEADKQLATGIIYVGEEDVAGVKARHFRVTVDAAKAGAASSSPVGTPSPASTASATPAPATSPGATASGATSPASATTVDYWLDDQDRTRKMVHMVSGVPTTTTYDKWGEPVTITVPPADQVTGPATSGATTTPAATKS